jgi:uncharacterized protein YkwD
MTRCRQLAILMITAVLLGGASGQTREARQPTPQPVVNAADVAQRIHKLVNAERRKHGLPALAWDEKLARIATDHSRDMERRNYVGHDSPEGHDLRHRYRQGGYKCEIRIGRTIHTGAENIALGRLYNSVTTRNGVAYYDWNSPQDIARRIVEGWMNSPGTAKTSSPIGSRRGAQARDGLIAPSPRTGAAKASASRSVPIIV